MGYAYASRAQVRAAYGWNAEASVYLREDCHGKGIGRALYTALLEILQMQRIQTVYAVITSPNEKSERFHTRMGFVPLARFPRTGFKQGAWRDVTWMQRSIGGYEVPPAPVIPVTGLPEGQVAGAIARAQALLSDTAAE